MKIAMRASKTEKNEKKTSCTHKARSFGFETISYTPSLRSLFLKYVPKEAASENGKI